MRTQSLAILFLAIVPSFALAESVEENQQRKRENEIFQAAVQAANKSCKSAITGTWDWKSFDSKLVSGTWHVGANCSDALTGLKNLCAGSKMDDVHKAVQVGIKNVECRGGGDTTTVQLAGGKLTISTSLGQKRKNVPAYTKDYLAKNLK